MDKPITNRPTVDAEEILEGIREWVMIETPSNDGAAVNKLVDLVGEQMNRLDMRLERVPGRDGYGDVLMARTPWGAAEGGDDEPGILVLSHLDTVHPIGTIENELPYRREGDSVFGPGIYDMKGGAYLAYYALRHIMREGRETPLPITFLYVPEEEIGSPTSREIIEREALKNKYVLVTEPAREGGRIVTARKGVGHFKIEVTGKPAHAGMRHQDGASAIREMARQILAVEALTDYDRGITTNVGLVSGGTGTNVVPAHCVAEAEARLPDPETADEICAKILGLQSSDPDVTITVTGGMNRPPYRKSEAIAALFEHAQGLAEEIGFDLKDVPLTGGGSDGNFTAGLGVPTLDGLGVDGRGAHAHDEQLYVSSLAPRAALMIRLLETLR
ncbi:MAG: M20/M25/M40 family metallo-hydrolase [Minwuiales bacterium]|nr:M20/M25/M40 family metallo-hydrolase [Minwuiales bacterium]